MRESPVYLLASERSGTNLLRKLVTQHQKVYYGPPPAHFLKHLYCTEPYYRTTHGYLDRDGFRLLLKDALALCYAHFSPWTINFNIDGIIARYESLYAEYNSILLSDLLMRTYATELGYQSYFCKDNNLFDFAFEILHFIPDAKFIYLHRDPRDVALSQRNRTLQTDSIRRIAKLWHNEQLKCLANLCHLPKHQIYRISYERLITNTLDEVQDLCEFLDVEFVESPTGAPVVTTERPGDVAKEWENLGNPVMNKNMNKFHSGLSVLEIQNIEAICGRQMNVLGYQRAAEPKKISYAYKLYDELWLHLWSVCKRKALPSGRDEWSEKRGDVIKNITHRRLG